MNLPSLQHISECFIKPKYTTEESKQPVYLAPWDLAMLSTPYMQKGFLFAKPPGFDTDQNYSLKNLLEKLKESLSVALVHFYTLSGRLSTLKQDDPHVCKICKEHMFSRQKLDASKVLRQEKLQTLHKYVQDSCTSGRVLNIGELVFITTLNLISCTICSIDFADFKAASNLEIKKTVQGLMSVLGTPNLSDSFPLLKAIDPQGIMRESEVYTRKILAIFDEITNGRLEARCVLSSYVRKNDLLEELLDLNQESDSMLSVNDIKHLFFMSIGFSLHIQRQYFAFI